MHAHQTVSEIAAEALEHQATVLVAATGQPFEDAMESIVGTYTGRRLRDLADGERREARAPQRQDSLRRTRTEEHRHYSWLEGYVGWLHGKEAPREQYYALLEEELAKLRGYK